MWGFFMHIYMYMKSVGIVIIARDTNKMLLLHRAEDPIVWSSLTGTMEDDETPMETIKREIEEEIGVNPNKIKNIKELGVTKNNHHVMIGFVDTEFVVPDLQIEENDDYGWFDQDNLPSPIFYPAQLIIDAYKSGKNYYDKE